MEMRITNRPVIVNLHDNYGLGAFLHWICEKMFLEAGFSKHDAHKAAKQYRKKKVLQLHIVLQGKQDRQALSCRIWIRASFHRCFPLGFILHYRFSLSCRDICVAELPTNV